MLSYFLPCVRKLKEEIPDVKTENEKTIKSKSKLSVTDLDFKKQSGLLPMIEQDESSGAVLILAYANLEGVKKTQESGFSLYFSSSR